MAIRRAEVFMPGQQPANEAALPWLEGRPKAAGGVEWVRALRETAAESFGVTGLPTPEWEGWQYTNLRPLKAQDYAYAPLAQATADDGLPARLLGDSHRIVLVNGQLQKGLSDLPAQAEVLDLMEAAATIKDIEEYLVSIGDLSDKPFKALNAAHMRDGFVLKLGRGVSLAKPVEVLFFTRGGAASYPRVLYWLGENSKMTVVEHHAGQGQYLANSHIDAVQERDSRLKLYRTVDETAEASHVSLTGLHMLKGAQFEGFSGAFGGRLCRQEFQMKLLERGIYSSISGIYLKEGQQSQDFTIVADHFEEDGTSKQHFKGVIDDQARAVFQGKIHVHRSAQKTDGYQSHHALLLSDQAEASAKPELEIYADDVKCSHGATSGQLNEEALFYLRSRGIPAQQAKALLIESFLNEGIDKIDHPEVRGLLQARVSAWLARRA